MGARHWHGGENHLHRKRVVSALAHPGAAPDHVSLRLTKYRQVGSRCLTSIKSTNILIVIQSQIRADSIELPVASVKEGCEVEA
jgi:hypothetical protein